jgi:DNA polymerase I-like protein with 3'-5' exonuclease and polymerase domains
MWKRWIRDELKATRTLITPLGRKREFRGRLNDDTFRAAYAFRPQSTVGELLQIAIQRIYSECSFAQVLLNVHDEVVTQILPPDRDRAIRDIRRIMEIPIDVKGRELIIPCDFKVGPSWGEMEEVK